MEHKEINIGTIAELLEALDDPNTMIRTGTLQAIASLPEKATLMAVKGGVDLFRELSNRLEAPREASFRAYYIQALLSLDDSRVVGLARETFLTAEDTDVILLSAQRLAELPEVERVSFLGPITLSSGDPSRARAAANLLACCRDLPTRLAIRVAVLADQAIFIPLLDEGNLAAWLEEFLGPYPHRTRKLLREKKDSSFAALLECWQQLPHVVQLWALRESVTIDPNKAGPLFGEVLARETDDELLLATLNSCPQLGLEAVKEELIAPYQRHKNPKLRAAAVRASRKDIGWADMLAEEKDAEVKIAIIARLGKEVAGDPLLQLAACLEDDDWRVRSAATAALVALAPASEPLLQERFSHGTLQVRTAAGQALQQLGMGDWLAARMSAA